MENILTITMWVVFGAACAYFAKKQKRNVYLWFFIGLLLGIFGLLLLLMLPTIEKFLKKDEKKKEASKEACDIESAKEQTDTLHVDPSYADTLWYYLDESKAQVGPMSFNALERNWHEGKINDSTYVWNEKLTDWKIFSEVATAQKEPSPE